MAHIISMPRYGATMQEGTLSSLSVKEGDNVSNVLRTYDIKKYFGSITKEGNPSVYYGKMIDYKLSYLLFYSD